MQGVYLPDFLQNQTDIFISVMLNRFVLNFGLAQRYGGKTNLRFDDTNPTKEDVEYVDSIKEDVHWLGFEWAGEYYASDYFEQLYEWALVLNPKRACLR